MAGVDRHRSQRPIVARGQQLPYPTESRASADNPRASNRLTTARFGSRVECLWHVRSLTTWRIFANKGCGGQHGEIPCQPPLMVVSHTLPLPSPTRRAKTNWSANWRPFGNRETSRTSKARWEMGDTLNRHPAIGRPTERKPYGKKIMVRAAERCRSLRANYLA